MRKANASSLLTMAAGLGAVAVLFGLLMLGGKRADDAPADKGITTETAAAAAGAKLIPSEPKLRVEPK